MSASLAPRLQPCRPSSAQSTWVRRSLHFTFTTVATTRPTSTDFICSDNRAHSRYDHASSIATMGNCCGKPSDENFSGEGRTVGSTPAARPKQSGAGTSKSSVAPQGGRTLGSSSHAPNGSSPREAAAKAAEVRTYRYTAEPGKRNRRNPDRMIATAWI